MRVLEENSRLEGLVSDYLMPSANFLTVVVDDVELNVKELRPPNMDETGKTKYPTLLAPYGGPGSQSVSQRFSVGWHEYLTTELKYIVLIVDGRGTGFKSKKVRDPVRGRLGTFEARDQLEVARIWAGQKKYVDKGRIGIWGWSFGGYLTGKVLELGGQEGSEGIFSLGMSVAPVTDWRFYDSVYTERYMLTPETNVQGYTDSAISNMTGFHQADYLLAQCVLSSLCLSLEPATDRLWSFTRFSGSADDNVHFANTASLLEKLTKDKVRRFESRMFVDSNHRFVLLFEPFVSCLRLADNPPRPFPATSQNPDGWGLSRAARVDDEVLARPLGDGWRSARVVSDHLRTIDDRSFLCTLA